MVKRALNSRIKQWTITIWAQQRAILVLQVLNLIWTKKRIKLELFQLLKNLNPTLDLKSQTNQFMNRKMEITLQTCNRYSWTVSVITRISINQAHFKAYLSKVKQVLTSLQWVLNQLSKTIKIKFSEQLRIVFNSKVKNHTLQFWCRQWITL